MIQTIYAMHAPYHGRTCICMDLASMHMHSCIVGLYNFVHVEYVHELNILYVRCCCNQMACTMMHLHVRRIWQLHIYRSRVLSSVLHVRHEQIHGLLITCMHAPVRNPKYKAGRVSNFAVVHCICMLGQVVTNMSLSVGFCIMHSCMFPLKVPQQLVHHASYCNFRLGM
jgi:hypothetical protein